MIAPNVAPTVGHDDYGKSREVRIGLVLYGGVSLAVYINGVVQEFFHAVNGNGVYRLVKALTDSDVVVDVISGTSAGGINGILLAYALCNKVDISGTSALWREHGDIGYLLRSPGEDAATTLSLLDSEKLQPRLTEVMNALRSYDGDVSGDPSSFDELDLFITGTDTAGRVFTEIDDAGHLVDIKDHRAVFRLKHRKGRMEDLNPDFPRSPDPARRNANREVLLEALSKLARITSSFPGAFAPVHVLGPDQSEVAGRPASRRQIEVDEKLRRWGHLEKESYFLDGGILDNKPFTHALSAIFGRHADREVDRKLCFVEPDPEVMSTAPQATELNFVQAVLASMIGIRGNESISDDLRVLAERNSKLVQFGRLIRTLQPTTLLPSATAAPEALRATGLGDDARRRYLRTRLIALSERVLQGVFRTNGLNDQIASSDRTRASTAIRAFDELTERVSLDEVDDWLNNVDVTFRLRRLYRIVYLIYDLLYQPGSQATDEQRQAYHRLWRLFNRQIELYEILKAMTEYVVDAAPVGWQDIEDVAGAERLWRLVYGALQMLLDDGSEAAQSIPAAYAPGARPANDAAWLPPEDLDQLNEHLRKLTDTVVQAIRDRSVGRDGSVGPDATSLLARLDEYEATMLAVCVPNAQDDVRLAYTTFEELDAQLFPLETLANLYEKDIIETIRISPRDAQRGFSRLDISGKVAGDTVYHFGGFFKRSWRSNDILWGRLDALCQIVETLVSRERLEAIVNNDARRARLRRTFLPDDRSWSVALDPSTLFPHAGAQTHHAFGSWLMGLMSDNPRDRDRALAPEELDRQITLLVEAAQLEILSDSLSQVVYDAFAEQATWNQVQIEGERRAGTSWLSALRRRREQAAAGQLPEAAFAGVAASPPWVFRSRGSQLDPFAASFTSERLAQDAVRGLIGGSSDAASRPSETGLGRFFVASYRVGAEKLTRDIPLPVLMETLAIALLVTRNCILGAFDEDRAERVRGHWVYRLGINLPLRSFYAIALLWRRAPGTLFGAVVGTMAVSILALAAGIYWSDPILFSGGQPHTPRFLAFVLVPLLVLGVGLVFLFWKAGRITRRLMRKG